METLTLNDLKPGERAAVIKVTGEGPLKRRLLDMGITPATEIVMRKRAPLGDPLEITIRGYELSVRKSEATLVSVRKL